MISFADPLWEKLESDLKGVKVKISESLRQKYAAPRHMGALKEYIASTLPGGRYMIVGAGTHSQAILPDLHRRDDVEILGVVDRQGKKMGAFHGYKVFAPMDKQPDLVDYYLLSHADREQEMAEALLAAGIDEGKIQYIYGGKAFQDFVISDNSPVSIHKDKLGDKDILILTTGRPLSCLINNNILADVFAPERTLECFMGRPNDWEEGGAFDKINLFQSLVLLDRVIAQTGVKLIYFKNTVQNSMPTLPVYLADQYPDIKVIHETYDLGSFIEDERLHNIWGFSQETIDEARLGELFSFRHGFRTIHKNVGSLWQTFEERTKGEAERYYPGVREDRPIRKAIDKTVRIVYPAGFRSFGKVVSVDVGSSLDIISLFEELVKQDGLEVVLYNHCHRSEEENDQFQYYMDRLAGCSISYNRCIPFEELNETISRYDFGWSYFQETDNLPTEYLWKVGLPNKFTDYVQAGLPTIVSSQFECVAEIVEEYGAGFVVSPEEPARIIELVHSANREELRDNVERLHGDMLQNNKNVLNRLRGVVQC